MSRWLLAATLALGLLATACSGDGASRSDSGDADGVAGVDVGTAELRAQRAEAGIPACPDDVRTGSAPVDGGLPELILPCLGGGQDVELSSLRGPLVVNLWASWCVPCREEAPDLAAAAARYGDRVQFLGVDVQDHRSSAADFIRDSGWSYPSVFDVPGAVMADLGITGPPATLFYAADGTLVRTNPGIVSARALDAGIRQLLA